MLDLGVALTWIAISTASAKGLSALARAAATTADGEADLASAGHEPAPAQEGAYPLAADAVPRFSRDCP